MTRAVLAIAAGILAGVIGMRYAARLRKEAASLHRWQELLTHLALVLEEGGATLPQAFLQVADANASGADEVLRHLAARLRSDPLTPLPDAFDALHLPMPAQSVLSPMMARLAHGSLASRCQAVTHAGAEIGLLSSAAGEKAAKDARMWSVLGWTGGACLTLLLI